MAAWRLHKELKGNIKQLQSCQGIVQTLFGKASDKTIGPVPSRMPVDETKFGGVFHACDHAEKQGLCKRCKKFHLHVRKI